MTNREYVLPGSGHKVRDVVELCGGFGLIMLVIWSRRPLQRYLFWCAVVWIVVASCVSFDGWREVGIRVSGFWRSMWVVGIAVVLVSVSVLVAARLGTLHEPKGVGVFLATFWGYCLWSFFQQFLLQAFFLLRLMRLLPGRWSAVFAAAGLFAVAHLPNPILTPLTLVWGLAACVLFLRYRNLYTLAVVHALMGVCLAITIPAGTIHNMRVGRGYLMYGAHHHAWRSRWSAEPERP